MSSNVGQHLVADFRGVAVEFLTNEIHLEAVCRAACEKCSATILHSHFYHFGGEHGVTGVIHLSESHLSVHSWPEMDYAAFDIFMCGSMNPKIALRELVTLLKPRMMRVIDIGRGFGGSNWVSNEQYLSLFDETVCFQVV